MENDKPFFFDAFASQEPTVSLTQLVKVTKMENVFSSLLFSFSISASITLSLSVSLSLYLSYFLSFCLCLSIFLFICFPVYLSVSLPYLPVSPLVCLFLCLFIPLSVLLSLQSCNMFLSLLNRNIKIWMNIWNEH